MSSTNNVENQSVTSNSQGKQSYLERKEFDKKIRKVERQIEAVESAIEKLESRQSEIETLLSEGTTEQIIYDEYDANKKELGELLKDWELQNSVLDELQTTRADDF